MNTVHDDVKQTYKTANAVTAVYQTSGFETPDKPTMGNGDSFKVVESDRALKGSDLEDITNKIQATLESKKAFLDNGHQDSAAAIAHINQAAPDASGNAKFNLATTSLGDCQVYVVKIDAQGAATLVDGMGGKGTPSNFGATNFGMNASHDSTIDLARSERAFVITASDGLHDGYMDAAKKGGDIKDWKTLLQQDVEAHIKGDPQGAKLSEFLAHKAVAMGSTDNVTVGSASLAHDTDLKNKAITLAVFDGAGHTDNAVSKLVANELGNEITGSRTPTLEIDERPAHISQRPADIAATKPGAAAQKVTPADLDTLKKAGSWLIAVSDQPGGGFKPVVTLSIAGKSPAEVAQIQTVLNKLSDVENGSKVINGLNESGLIHPVTNSRQTLSIEGGIGLKGIENIMKVSDVLKQSGAGHFEWNDDDRGWKNSTQNKMLSEIEPARPKAAFAAAAANNNSPSPDQRIVIVPSAAPKAIDPVRPTAAFAVAAANSNSPFQQQKMSMTPAAVTASPAFINADPEKRINISPGAAPVTAAPVRATVAFAVAAEGGTKPVAPAAPAAASIKSVDIDLNSPAAKSSVSVQGQKLDGKLGRAGTAAEVVESVAKGDYTGAAVAVAKDEGSRLLVQKGVTEGAELIGKRIPVVGAVVTVGLGLAAAGAVAYKGEYGKAAAELGATAAEAVGNVVGFGAGDALRETFRAAVKYTAGEKYAPEKSGLRKLAEVALDVGGKAMDSSKYGAMSKSELGTAILKDGTLPDTVKMGNKEVPLTQALEDKTFRTTYIKNLESAAAKGNDLQAQINMVKAYDDKLSGSAEKGPAVVARAPTQQPLGMAM